MEQFKPELVVLAVEEAHESYVLPYFPSRAVCREKYLPKMKLNP